MFIIDRWVDNRRPEVPMENGRPCSDHEGSSLAQVSQPYLPLSKCNLGSSVITRFNTKHSFRFTLEKYVSDYCNIKTNTGETQHYPFLEFQILLYLISKQAQAFRYLISSSISANNALLRLLVKKRKWSLNFPKGSISQKAFKGFHPVEPIGNRNHGIVHEFAILDCSPG